MADSSSGLVTRRRVLTIAGTAAAVAGAGLLPGTEVFGATRTRTVYSLDPEWGAGDPHCPDPHAGSQSCHACSACHTHASAKLWTSAGLADFRRAHHNCKCIVRSRGVTPSEYIMLFGPSSGPQHRDEFDRRRDELFFPGK